MPGKNDLKRLMEINATEEQSAILPSIDSAETKQTPSKKAVKKTKMGRPKKSEQEKRDFKITLSITQSEGQKILDKSGLADNATYLYDFLKKNGAFD